MVSGPANMISGLVSGTDILGVLTPFLCNEPEDSTGFSLTSAKIF